MKTLLVSLVTLLCLIFPAPAAADSESTALFEAVLAEIPPPIHGRCIERHRIQIARLAEGAAAEQRVPVGVLIVVGLLETHWGCAGGESGGWGAPASVIVGNRLVFPDRHVAGTPTDAARVLARSYAACHSWRGAVGMFRSGVCGAPHNRGYVESVMRLTAGAYARAGLAAPPGI